MPGYKWLESLGIQPNDGDNRITIVWENVTYSVNQRVLDKYVTVEDLVAAITKFLGYFPEDLFFHKNRNQRWVVAVGVDPMVKPGYWPEDAPPIEGVEDP